MDNGLDIIFIFFTYTYFCWELELMDSAIVFFFRFTADERCIMSLDIFWLGNASERLLLCNETVLAECTKGTYFPN
jgi:hypothetical protein